MRLLKNKEAQKALGFLLILLIVFGAISAYLIKNYTEEIYQAQLRQNIAVIGAVAQQYPDVETEIVKSFTKNLGSNFDYGKQLLIKYGYTENLSIYKNDVASLQTKGLRMQLLLCFSVFAFAVIAFGLYSYNILFKRIRLIGQGAEAVVEGRYEPIEGDKEEGDIGFLIYQFNLMTERLNENVDALQNEKVFLKRLITDISHQLKTPLASLVMFNDIMKNDENLPEPDRVKFVDESKNQLDRMEWLIKNMLKMAKLEAGVVDFEMEQAFVGQTIQKSISGLKYLAQEKNIKINMVGDDSIVVRHDTSWTAEALSNIVKNCIEHSKPGDYVNIFWEQNNVFVQIEVKDNGLGIPKEELPRIFDRFYKGPNSCNPTNIGIGLYIAKTVIEGQEGSIYVNSEPAKGTKFTVRLMKISH